MFLHNIFKNKTCVFDIRFTYVLNISLTMFIFKHMLNKFRNFKSIGIDNYGKHMLVGLIPIHYK